MSLACLVSAALTFCLAVCLHRCFCCCAATGYSLHYGAGAEAIYFGSAYWPNSHDGGIANNTGAKQPGCDSGPDRPRLCSSPSDNCCGPWIGADLEAGMYYGGGPNGTNEQNKPLDHDFVSLMLKGRTDSFALKGGDATTGKFSTMFDGVRPIRPVDA